MADFPRLSDPDKNGLFSRDWSGAGRLQIRLAAEAAAWLKARQRKRAQATTPQPPGARFRALRST